jgi:chaperone modulatory protein CbpM
MSEASSFFVQGSVVVEEEIQFTLVELCRVCSATEEQVAALVSEGVLEPAGQRTEEWRFAGTTLRRARVALRLTRDLEINAAGVALVLDMLEEIESLKARLARTGGR